MQATLCSKNGCLAGAIVQSTNAAKTLRTLPRYPIEPCDWAAANPDIQILLDVMATDSIESLIKPAYNAVYAGGTPMALRRSSNSAKTCAALKKHIQLGTGWRTAVFDTQKQ